jgi:hypothetical protein
VNKAFTTVTLTAAVAFQMVALGGGGTAHAERTRAPRQSAARSELAFASPVARVIRADGTHVRRLAGRLQATSLLWSPDGTRLALVDPKSRLWVLDSRGKTSTLLGHASTSVEPSWSPTSKKLTYVDGGRVFVAGIDGHRKKAVTRDLQVQYVAWSTTEDEIAYTMGATGHLYVMSSDGSHKTLLAADGDYGFPAWSPDGTQIAYRALDDADPEKAGIYVTNADGGGQTKVADGTDFDLSWSPNGSRILYNRTYPDDDNVYVFVVRVDFEPGEHNIGVGLHPVWSPDGTTIAYEHTRGSGSIWTMRVDGSRSFRLTPHGVAASNPTWAMTRPAPPTSLRCGGVRATIVGSRGQDTLKATRRADVIVGLGGNDTITGAGHNDVICGNAGNDRLTGSAGRDRMFGGLGDDFLVGGPGKDTLRGGPGRDELRQ